MSNTKNLADLLKVCSILPALAIMPAMAGVEDYIWNPNFDSYTLEVDEKLPDPDSVENAQFNGMRSPTGKFELDGSNFTLDANGWAGLSVGADEEFNMHDFKMVKNFEKAASGGAFLSITGGVLTIDNVHFMNNSSVGGGAIASGAASAQDGGQAADVAISNSKFTANSATSSGGAISNNASLLKLSNVDFVGNMSGRDGGAVDNNNGGILEISNGAVFKNNIATQNGGAIFAGDVSVIGDILFEENEALNAGAVHVGNKSFVVKKDAQGNDNTVTFKKNVATGNAGAFFVGANGTVDITATNIDFIENSGAGNGGTIYVQDGTLKLLGENNTFFNNQSTKSEKTYKRGGGVIHNQINSDGSTIVIGGSENSINSFTYNKAVVNGGAILSRGDGNGYESNMTLNGTTVFEKNDAGMNGGALYQYVNAKDTMNVVFNGNVDFDDNNAGENGGAIFNYSSVDGIASIKFNGEVEFENNIAGQNGGAIYNNGTLDLSDAESTFVINKANESGGAIYNAGKLTIADSDFVENSALEQGGAINSAGTTSELYISNSKFENNKVTGETENHQLGGAIKISGIAEISDTDFIGNSADGFAGAIYAGTQSDVTFENVLFQGNTASGVGALGLYKNGQLKNVRFIENHSLEGDSGALFLGAVSSTYVDGTVADSWFEGNTAATLGGAIGTRDFVQGNNKDAVLDIKNTTFIANEAGMLGGAFSNYFYHSYTNADAVYVENSSFSDNIAAKGGAVYNHGKESAGDAPSDAQRAQVASIEFNGGEFVGNIAADLGGAIYNETGAKVFLSGTNTFTGNKANDVANDIHNLGTLTIASGTTTMDGGITGDGILDIKSGATLDMGKAMIEQSVVNIDGVLKSYALNAQQGINLSGDVTGSGKLEFNVGTAGTYDMSKFADLDLEYVGTVFVSEQQGDNIIIRAKPMDKLAEEVGISMEAASAVASLATASDAKLQELSLMVQEVLATEGTAVVEQEMAKLKPADKPITQSVAASVQGQVLTVASGRMASVGGTTGRAGGDVTASGVWAQGLFNKSKLNGQFHGYTRGFALGADTVVDNVYTVGAGYAYSSTDIHSNGMTTDVESNSMFVYGQYKPSEWSVNVTMNYTASDYTDNASLFGVALDNEYSSDAFGMQTMVGYDFENGVSQEFGVRYLHVSQDKHIDALGRTIQEINSDFLSAILGVNYAFAIENDWAVALRPELRAAMTYDVVSDSSIATILVPGSSAYYVDVENLSRLGGEFGIGLTAEYRGLEISLNYELDLHRDYTSQTGMLKFRYDF